MPMRALLPLGFFLLLVVAMGIGLTRDPSAIPSVLIDRTLPPFSIEALDPEDPPYTNEDVVGDVTLVNIFGSWCVACKIEHPTLMDIAETGVVDLHGINWRDTREAANQVLVETGDPYTRIGFDDESDLAIELGVTGAPETYVFDQEGRIRYKHVGPITETVWEETIKPIVLRLEAGE